LFIAALNQAFERIIESFEQIKSNNADIVEDMITAYETISNKYPNEVNIQVIAFSVTEENIQNTVRTVLLKIRDYALKRIENEKIIEIIKQIKSKKAENVEEKITAYKKISNKYPNEINIQVIAFSVTEENIQNTVRTGLLKIRDYALKRFENENVNNPENEVTTFLARGILCNISQFINLPSLINRNLNK